jgi:hypothetical protein
MYTFFRKEVKKKEPFEPLQHSKAVKAGSLMHSFFAEKAVLTSYFILSA